MVTLDEDLNCEKNSGKIFYVFVTSAIDQTYARYGIEWNMKSSGGVKKHQSRKIHSTIVTYLIMSMYL